MALKDKWGIPFIYKTASDAGLSGKGEAFFWQQNNNILTDSKNGIVRIGKELDQIDVISTTTGEWEFPYDSGADTYTLETETGHHSGGENHGCEGAEYMIEVDINTTPPAFRFRKQMYHGGSKYARSTVTNSKAIEKVVGNGWKGFCVVRYNVKDGKTLSDGSKVDSVKLEGYWCEDPDNHLDTWVKVIETEDKGGWGSGGDTCDGRKDQEINWSNVQMRYKSGTPEWSVHPIIPEFENGSNIHSIGEENMSFSDSERRGYGKDIRMPRDIEMKILFKFASNNGIARLKNASIREITPKLAFDDTPSVPDPGEPQESQTVSGSFKLQWDLNSIRSSSCAGVGAGGAGGNTIFYEVTTVDDGRTLINNSGHEYRTRVVESCITSSSILKSKIPHQLDIYLKKDGSPSGNVVAKIWNAANSVVYTCPTTVTASGLSTSYSLISYNFSTNTYALAVGDRIGVESTANTGEVDYVSVGISDTDSYGSTNRSNYNDNTDTWIEVSGSEVACIIWD